LAGVGFGSAKISIDLEESFAGQMGADIGWRKRDAEQADAGGAKEAGISAYGPILHTAVEFVFGERGKRGEDLKEKGGRAVEANEARGRG
jgi:hypothetical protein